MRWKLLFACLFLATGLALAGYSEYCFSRSGPTPVSIPILGSSTHISRKFLAFASSRYRIGMVFDEPEKLADCIADPPDSTNECSGISSRLKASWTLSWGNQVLQNGTTSEPIWRVQGQPFLGLGVFQAEAWQWYQLNVDAKSYDSALSRAKPRLVVEVWTEKSFLYQPKFLAVKLAARIIYGSCLFIGGLLILSHLIARREALFAALR
jgi:hypothetical protein